MYNKYFQRKKALTGHEIFYTLSADAPEILHNFVRKTHGEFDLMPNDWLYEQIYDALIAFEVDVIDLDDLSIEPDHYYCALLEWLKYFWQLVDECNSELGRPDKFIDEIQQANWYVKDRVHRLVHAFLVESPFGEEEEEEEAIVN